MSSYRKIGAGRPGAWCCCAVFLLSLALGPAVWAGPEASGDQLRLVIILSRHGVRSPLATNEAMAQYSAQPWPAWDVAPGIQTAHGNKLIALLGDYYRARFAKDHLLSGDAATDGPLVFIRTDNDQRTIETGRILGKAFVPVGEPDVHAVPQGAVDPLFRPLDAQVGHPDPALATAAVLGRMGGDPRNVERAYAVQLDQLRGVLRGPGPSTPSALDAPTTVTPGKKYFPVALNGPLAAALTCTDYFLLEYAEGRPPSEVGWGRVDGRVLTEMLKLHDLYFDLTQRTFYLAQIGSSNLASHIVDTMEQCALGQAIPGALGPSGERIVVLVGHDTNIASMGGLLGMSWCVAGSQFNPTLPGGALVFELWKRGGPEGAYYLRTSYVAQTLEQMRESTPLSLETPPARAPIFIPGCGGPGRDFDAPLDAFVRQARRVIDPAFIAPEP